MLASFAGTEASAAEWDDAKLGLAKESATVSYSLDGDTLVFDGATFTRVK